MFKRILYGWNFSRVVRLAIGAFFMIDGIVSGIWQMAAFGLFFALMPLFNIGCCSAGSCSTKVKEDIENQDEEVIFEEIKLKKE